MKLRKMRNKSLRYQVMTRTAPIFTIFSFAAVLFLVYADCRHAYSKGNNVLGATAPKGNEVLDVTSPTHKAYAATSSPPVAVSHREAEGDSEELDRLTPPRNFSKEKRIEWFRRRLPRLKILNSTSKSQRFHGRVLELFSRNCSAQIFMVWLSSAETFGHREFLAVDSLFSTNPNSCLAILSSSLDSPSGHNILKPLLDRGFNILVVTPDIPFLVQNTPAESWLKKLKSGNMDPGSIPLFMNLSDLTRLAVLYKYGGVYLDTDFIFLKNLTSLRNAIGAQSVNTTSGKWTRLNNAVMVFDVCHPLLFEFLQEFSTTFNGNRWGANSPYLVSRVIERLGNRPEYNLTILPPKAFYPVNWIDIPGLFKKPATTAEAKWVEKTWLDISTRSYMIHLWNKVTREMNIEGGSVMQKLISTHCMIRQNTNNFQVTDMIQKH